MSKWIARLNTATVVALVVSATAFFQVEQRRASAVDNYGGPCANRRGQFPSCSAKISTPYGSECAYGLYNGYRHCCYYEITQYQCKDPVTQVAYGPKVNVSFLKEALLGATCHQPDPNAGICE